MLCVCRQQVRRDRAREQAVAPAGVKSLRSRLQVKKERQREAGLGDRRHDDAMKELLRRRNEQKLPGRGPGGAGGGGGGGKNPLAAVRPNKGAAAGIRTKNKHLQDFEAVKQGHMKRRRKFV